MHTLIGEVSNDWTWTRLGAACDVQPGPSASHYQGAERAPTGTPVVAPKDIKDNKLTARNITRVSDAVADRLHRYRLAPGDIVCVRVGDPRRHALVDDKHNNWLLGTACIRLRSHGQVLPEYLHYYLAHPAVRYWRARNATGAAISTINKATLVDLPLVLPPLPTQHAVVDVLRALDQQAAVNAEIVRATVALRDTLLPQLLAGEITVDLYR